MIGLMREARLGARDAAELRWGDVVRVADGTGRVHVRRSEDGGTRAISSDTLRLISSIRRGPGDDAPVIGLSRSRIEVRIAGAAEQARLGRGSAGTVHGSVCSWTSRSWECRLWRISWWPPWRNLRWTVWSRAQFRY